MARKVLSDRRPFKTTPARTFDLWRERRSLPLAPPHVLTPPPSPTQSAPSHGAWKAYIQSLLRGRSRAGCTARGACHATNSRWSWSHARLATGPWQGCMHVGEWAAARVHARGGNGSLHGRWVKVTAWVSEGCVSTLRTGLMMTGYVCGGEKGECRTDQEGEDGPMEQWGAQGATRGEVAHGHKRLRAGRRALRGGMCVCVCGASRGRAQRSALLGALGKVLLAGDEHAVDDVHHALACRGGRWARRHDAWRRGGPHGGRCGRTLGLPGALGSPPRPPTPAAATPLLQHPHGAGSEGCAHVHRGAGPFGGRQVAACTPAAPRVRLQAAEAAADAHRQQCRGG